MRRLDVRSVLLATLLATCGACDDDGPTTPHCIELDRGEAAACRATSDAMTFWAIRPGDYQSFLNDCYGGVSEYAPPRPSDGQTLLFVSARGVGCTGCLTVSCVKQREDSLFLETAGGFSGLCEVLLGRGAWALVAGDHALGDVALEHSLSTCAD